MRLDSADDAARLVAILRGIEPGRAVETGGVLRAAGIRVIEVPLNSPDPFASIEIIARLFGDQVLVGAGTVLEARDVDKKHSQIATSHSPLRLNKHGSATTHKSPWVRL